MRKIHVPLRSSKGTGSGFARSNLRGERGCCSNTRDALSSPEYSDVVKQGFTCTLVLCVTLLVLHLKAPRNFYTSLFTSATDMSLSEQFPEKVYDISSKTTNPTKDSGHHVGSSQDCTDPLWCGIPMPRKSLFGFAPPTDGAKWRQAREEAVKGEHILLREINKVITSPFDFLDGDPFYRRHHFMADVFVDEENWLAPLTRTNKQHLPKAAPGSSTGMEGVKTSVYQRVPTPYNFSVAGRSPIVQIGYNLLNKNNNAFFTGDRKGVVRISRKLFLQEWSHVRSDIAVKYIVIVLTDPDWGWLSSYIKGRTLDKGRCCREEGDELLQQFLDDQNLLLLVVNQHTTISHPKILSLPRGLPTKWEHNERVIFDSIHLLLSGSEPKSRLLIGPMSTWKNSKEHLTLYTSP